jgi:glycosyltransferase involved in cell wall biosynthesis
VTKGRKIILDLIRSIDPDIIHAHAPTIISYIASNYKESLNIMTFHHSYIENYTWPIYRKIKFNYLQKAVARQYSILTTMSGHMTDYFKKLLRRNIEFIENGYNDNIFKDKNKIRQPRSILYVGQLTVAKGVDILFKLASMLQDYTFTFVGEGLLKNTIDLPNVSFKGLKTPTELSDYYNTHEYAVFPSKYENFPLVGLEAMACGAVVIASDKGFPAYISDGEDGFIVSDPTVEKIYEIINNHPDKQLIKNNAINKSKKYTLSEVYKKYRSLYENVQGTE